MTREEFMLAVLAAGDGEPYSPVQIQKLFFLLERNVAERIGGPWFNFQPHDYGPFDKAVFEVLRELAARGLVTITSPRNEPPSYASTHKGLLAGQRLLDQFPPAIADYIRRLSAWVRTQSFASLMSYIYREFPLMSENSVFRGPR